MSNIVFYLLLLNTHTHTHTNKTELVIDISPPYVLANLACIYINQYLFVLPIIKLFSSKLQARQ